MAQQQGFRPQYRMQRRGQVELLYGKSRSSIYADIADGVWPPSVRLGANCVAWLEHETQAVLAARVAGKTAEEVRELVKELVAARALPVLAASDGGS